VCGLCVTCAGVRSALPCGRSPGEAGTPAEESNSRRRHRRKRVESHCPSLCVRPLCLIPNRPLCLIPKCEAALPDSKSSMRTFPQRGGAAKARRVALPHPLLRVRGPHTRRPASTCLPTWRGQRCALLVVGSRRRVALKVGMGRRMRRCGFLPPPIPNVLPRRGSTLVKTRDVAWHLNSPDRTKVHLLRRYRCSITLGMRASVFTSWHSNCCGPARTRSQHSAGLRVLAPGPAALSVVGATWCTE
jgi:hypothetical protein